MKVDEYVLKGKHPRRTIHTESNLNKLTLMYAVHEDTTLLDSYESYIIQVYGILVAEGMLTIEVVIGCNR